MMNEWFVLYLFICVFLDFCYEFARYNMYLKNLLPAYSHFYRF
jgi:hypothetical protein